MYAAIDQAKASGLKGKEANDLVRTTNSVASAIDRRDRAAAVNAADDLVAKVGQLVNEGRVQGAAADRLTRDARQLRASIPSA